MGIYLNPGNRKFIDTVNSKSYVDKTLLISYLNTIICTEQKYASVLRPRRFGKTLTASMICAYYDIDKDSRYLFENKKLGKYMPSDADTPSWDKYLNQYEVIRVTMTDFIKSDKSVHESIQIIRKRLLDELEEKYPDVRYDRDDLSFSMEKLYYKIKIPFVIVIDEWDEVFRCRKEDSEGQKLYLDFLEDWLKDKEYIALAYMTGILPIKKYGKHSALNMFDEYSMTSPMQMAEYTGFTSDEVKDLCRQYGRDYEQIKEWYDGYEVRDIVPFDPDHQLLMSTGKAPEARVYSLYSPLSVVKAVTTGLIQNYWNTTETYEALETYINMNYEGLKDIVSSMMEGMRKKIRTDSYQNDMTNFKSADDVLTMLIHLGYLGYDSLTGEIFIPNKEVRREFEKSTQSESWDLVFKKLRKSEELLQATWEKNTDKIANILEYFHDKSSKLHYNSEEDLSVAIRNAYYTADNYYLVIPELDSGKGYVDIAYLPLPKAADKPALLIDLKYEKRAETAIDQIHKKRYPDRLEAYKGNLLLVGITYKKDNEKHHECIIEEA